MQIVAAFGISPWHAVNQVTGSPPVTSVGVYERALSLGLGELHVEEMADELFVYLSQLKPREKLFALVQ